jgi:hypothetical protein
MAATDCSNENPNTDSDNKALYAILLSVTCPFFKETKYQPYDRRVLFGDLFHPPTVFSVYLETTVISDRFFKHARTGICVGQTFYIWQPDKVEAKQSEQTLLVLDATIDPLLPLRPHPLPSVAMMSPEKCGQYSYFLLNHVDAIHTRREQLVCASDGASCTGIFCDRARPLQRNQRCGCFHIGSTHMAFVFQLDVLLLDVPKKVNPFGIARIDEFRSFRTTQLFIKDVHAFGALTDDQVKSYASEDSRLKIRKMVEHIRANGGFTVAGWYRRGWVADASAVSSCNKIESDHLVIHLSLLIPTDKTVLATDEYKKLMISHETAPAPVAVDRYGSNRSMIV